MQQANTPLYQMMESGGWTGAGWKAYLDMQKLRDDAVRQAALVESEASSDEDFEELLEFSELPEAVLDPPCGPAAESVSGCTKSSLLEGPGPVPAGRVGVAPSTPDMTPIEPWHACYHSPTAPVRQDVDGST